jgi:hypothetical protein
MTDDRTKLPEFHEVRRMRHPAVLIIVLGVPFGSGPAPNAVLWMLPAAFGTGLPLFILAIRLETRVSGKTLRFSLFPLQLRWREVGIARDCVRRGRPLPTPRRVRRLGPPPGKVGQSPTARAEPKVCGSPSPAGRGSCRGPGGQTDSPTALRRGCIPTRCAASPAPSPRAG